MVAQLREGSEKKGLKWVSVDLREIIDSGRRLEGSLYSNDGKQTMKDLVRNCKWNVVYLCGENGLATAYHRPRFKRIYVDKSTYPIYQPAQINEIHPKPSAYISGLTRTDIDALRVKRGQVLLTCSGTIGNCTYVRNTLDNLIFSHDLIRIEPKEYSGFVYAFLRSKTGFSIINANNYGAVVEHIEPENLDHVPIPNPPPALKQKIHNLIEESFKLRDESNELIDAAQACLKEALQLPPINILEEQAEQFNKEAEVLNYSVPLNKMIDRFDGSYYVPVVKLIEQRIEKTAKEVTRLGNSRISQSIILPGHFKRIYVDEGSILIGGKDLGSLDPIDKHYLASKQYKEKLIKDMLLAENMIIVSAKGTPGKVTVVPTHWDGWFISSNLIKIVPVSEKIAGFLYCFLSSPYGETLIKRQIYGAVVDIIEPVHVESIIVPFLRNETIQWEINEKVLEANRKRTEAYNLEQKALRVLDEKVIYAR